MRFSEVDFQCSTDLPEPLSWSVIFASKTTSEVLFVRGNLTSIGDGWYRIDTSILGQYNLIVISVHSFAAGKYKCSEGSLESGVEADLAVIGKFVKSL